MTGCKSSSLRVDQPKTPSDDGRRPRRSNEEIEKEREKREKLEKEVMSAEEKRVSALEVKNIDFHLEENRRNHHTEEYEKQELVLRRGQSFILTINFMDDKPPFNPSRDEIVLKFETGNHPMDSLGTRINVKQFTSVRDLRSWGFEILECNGKSLKVSIMTSPFSVVGEYTIIVRTHNKETGTIWMNDDILPVYLLFNSWCEDDPVYMPDEDERHEYVLNENGMIWRQEDIDKEGFEWYFGQFEEVSLDCALYLLHGLSKLSVHLMGNAVLVSRSLSALVNNCDEDGILVGNWSGEYGDGERPTFWDGTVDILERYMSDLKPVKYGQCWVFSAVLTTLGRTLGIPTRSVTNFSSAHDTDGSVTIDRFLDKDFNPIDGNDSVWNFHVWNEVWMKRFDLPPGYDGWQAIDSTPQESSSGILILDAMCCGPSPIKAIKEGDLPIGNDTPFVYAEVNADVIYWQEIDDEYRPIEVRRDVVGTSVITKKVGYQKNKPYGVDIKSEYKYPPGPEEKRVTTKAVAFGSKCEYVDEIYKNVTVEDVSFFILLDPKNGPVIGQDCSVRLRLNNESKETRTVKVGMEVRIAFYTGMANKEPCKTLGTSISLPGMSESFAHLDLTAEDYVDSIVDAQSVFRVFFHAEVAETGQQFIRTINMTFDAPPLQMNVPESLEKGDTLQVKVSFTNPLPRGLEGVLHVSGRLFETCTIRDQKVPPNGDFTAELEVNVKPNCWRYGWTTLKVSFTSKQLTSSNYKWINVKEDRS